MAIYSEKSLAPSPILCPLLISSRQSSPHIQHIAVSPMVDYVNDQIRHHCLYTPLTSLCILSPAIAAWLFFPENRLNFINCCC